MSEWKSTTLGQFISLRRGYDLPNRDRNRGDIPVIGSGGIVGWHDTPIVKGPGITIGRAANLGVPTLTETDFWPLNTTLYVTDFHGNDVRFTYYLLKTLDLTGFNSGSVQPMLNRNYIQNFPLTVPEPRRQRSIAAVLGALDDKIAVNDRIADTARQLGLAIFQQGLQAADCTYERIGDLTHLVVRGVTPRYSEKQDALTVLNQKCIRGGRVSLAAARRTDAEKVPATKMLQRNDVVVNSTGVGTLGRVARWTGAEDCTVDSHVTIVRFDENKIDPVGAGFAMLLAQPEIERLGEGSTGQTELNRAKLASLVLRLPRREWLNSVRPKLEALESRGDAALAESVKLAKLRDTLLPKLMSGEIRVRDAEREVENAL